MREVGVTGTVNLWQSFLRLEIVTDYRLSPTEAAILLAKFPDENTVKSNKEVAEEALAEENNDIPINPETVQKQMWRIYNERFCPKGKREGFSGYNDRGSEEKDAAFLKWLKSHEKWQPNQRSAFSTGDRTPVISSNPFIPQTGKVDDPQLFFGRKGEIRDVFEVLNNKVSVALIGEEGIGKSSLLWAICQQAENFLLSPRQPIYLDLNGIRDEDEFYTALCEEVGIFESSPTMLNRALKNHRVLLAIDNYGKMAREGFSLELREHLRFLAEGSNASVKMIVAASEPLKRLFNDCQDDITNSPPENIFQDLYIKPWNEATARAFIQARLAMTSVCFAEEEISQLVQESGGHPRRLMQLCYQNYARYMEDVK
ncbi:ATP-binding protein [Microcoleus vaginatus GB1-A2]|uniref:ATP-binding protein n=1 Tax=Microcoleus vaginatus TaxID=119532 RepID=UPI0016827187|nr:ATP-binding protein [Microcoleus sp. FACHB-61]